ncbi:hypothetical protein F4604DRAFT_1674418 [Suillus subluteus]|nr:hypothetical protein F4604DRAFT_1674418 [Suillus subluteus]
MTDQCGLGADGTLLDASQIQWYNDPDDDTPLPPAACRSTHIPHPAPKLVDPNNAVLRKRKARSVVMSEGSEEENINGIIPSESESTYQQMKEMGNADHQGAKRCKSDLMADVRTIFTCEAKAMNPDTGKEETGHWGVLLHCGLIYADTRTMSGFTKNTAASMVSSHMTKPSLRMI